MSTKFQHWVLILVLTSLIVGAFLFAAYITPVMAQADNPSQAGGGLPAVMANAYGLIIGAAVIVGVIFAGVALRRWKS